MPTPGSMTATTQSVMEGKHSSAEGAQLQVMTTNPSIPARQPPVHMSPNINQGSRPGIVGYNQTPSNASKDSAMTVMASSLTNIDMQEANEVLSNVFGYPWALKEMAKTKGYWFRMIQREEWEHIARGADAITLRMRSGQDLVIRSKNKKGEPYGAYGKKDDMETPGVVQVIRPAAAPQPAPTTGNPNSNFSYQPPFMGPMPAY